MTVLCPKTISHKTIIIKYPSQYLLFKVDDVRKICSKFRLFCWKKTCVLVICSYFFFLQGECHEDMSDVDAGDSPVRASHHKWKVIRKRK